jgi:prolipoprotein diacylglyceryltransferase
MHKKIKDKKQPFFILVVLTYLVAYSLLRFSLEFIRIDPTPVIFGLRFPQIISLIIIAAAIIYFIWDLKRDQAKLEYFKNLW